MYKRQVHNEDKPFIVETSKGNVSVLGTKFDVMAYSGEDDFVATLMAVSYTHLDVYKRQVRRRIIDFGSLYNVKQLSRRYKRIRMIFYIFYIYLL